MLNYIPMHCWCAKKLDNNLIKFRHTLPPKIKFIVAVVGWRLKVYSESKMKNLCISKRKFIYVKWNMVLKLHGINFLIYVVRSQYKPAGILQVKMKEIREGRRKKKRNMQQKTIFFFYFKFLWCMVCADYKNMLIRFTWGDKFLFSFLWHQQ